MGLFDFVKDVGRQVFDTDAEAADNIKQHLEMRLHGLSNLEVDFDDGTLTVIWTANIGAPVCAAA